MTSLLSSTTAPTMPTVDQSALSGSGALVSEREAPRGTVFTTTGSSDASAAQIALYVRMETRAERLMTQSNLLADVAAHTMGRHGVGDAQIDHFMRFCEVIDELAALSRLFEILDAGSR